MLKNSAKVVASTGLLAIAAAGAIATVVGAGEIGHALIGSGSLLTVSSLGAGVVVGQMMLPTVRQISEKYLKIK